MARERPTGPGFAQVGEARLYYEVAGDGHPLVLIHAGIADSRLWDDQFGELARRYRTIRYDQRGFGRSEAPPGAFAPRDDLHGLLRHLGVERTCLVGVSMGGRVAAEFALAYPEQVDALVLVASTAGRRADMSAVEQLQRDIESAWAAGDLDRVNELELQLWVDGPGSPPSRVDLRVRDRVRAMNRRALELDRANEACPEAERSQPQWQPDAGERLAEIAVPTLIVIGDRDVPGTVAVAGQLAATIPGARQVVFEGAAHMLTLEQPARFLEVLTEFLAGLPGRRSN